MKEFMEPCSLERDLYEQLRAMPICPFQTQGNVTFEHLLRGLSHRAGDPLTMVIATPEVTIPMLRMIAWLYRRKWLTDITFMTHADQTKLFAQELGDYPFDALVNTEIGEGMLVMRGEKFTVAVQGELLTEPVSPKTCKQYTACMSNDKEILATMLDTLDLQLRKARRSKNEHSPSETAVAVGPAEGKSETSEAVPSANLKSAKKKH